MGGAARHSHGFAAPRRREGPPHPPRAMRAAPGGHSAVPSGRAALSASPRGRARGGGSNCRRRAACPSSSRKVAAERIACHRPERSAHGAARPRPAPPRTARVCLGGGAGQSPGDERGDGERGAAGRGPGGARRPLPGSRWAFSSPARGKEIMKRLERGAARRKRQIRASRGLAEMKGDCESRPGPRGQRAPPILTRPRSRGSPTPAPPPAAPRGRSLPPRRPGARTGWGGEGEGGVRHLASGFAFKELCERRGEEREGAAALLPCDSQSRGGTTAPGIRGGPVPSRPHPRLRRLLSCVWGFSPRTPALPPPARSRRGCRRAEQPQHRRPLRRGSGSAPYAAGSAGFASRRWQRGASKRQLSGPTAPPPHRPTASPPHRPTAPPPHAAAGGVGRRLRGDAAVTAWSGAARHGTTWHGQKCLRSARGRGIVNRRTTSGRDPRTAPTQGHH